jgi:hypothetical protein
VGLNERSVDIVLCDCLHVCFSFFSLLIKLLLFWEAQVPSGGRQVFVSH